MKITRTLLIFLGILVLAIFLRFYQLSIIPPSPSLDEVTIGYNAYSILQTGKDEYGYKFPVLLRAYDDYRPALYVYLVIPFIKFLGLTVLAVRLPSAILSVITVISSFFLTKEIFKKYKYKIFLALLTMFFIAISPWHLYISRLGHEVNPGSTFGVLGILFFLKSISKEHRRWFIILSFLFFDLALYTYQSEKVFIPLIIVVLFLCFLRKLMQMKKEIIIAVVMSIIITFPIISVSFSKQGFQRFSATSAFTNLGKEYQDNSQTVLFYEKKGDVFLTLLNNRRLIPVKIFLSNYFSHFDFHWLTENTGNNGKEQFKIPGLGVLYLWEVLLIILGIFFLLLMDIEKDKKIIIFSWIGISFIAPAITTQAPHAMRSFTLLPAPQILDSLGFMGTVGFLISRRNIFLKKFIAPLLVILLFFIILNSLIFLYEQYFFVFPIKESRQFEYACYMAMEYVSQQRKEYKKIIVSNMYADLSEAYMYYLFESKYNPEKYLKNGGTVSGGFSAWHHIDNIEFRSFNWMAEKKETKTLYVGSIYDFPLHFSDGINVNYLNGKTGIKLVTR